MSVLMSTHAYLNLICRLSVIADAARVALKYPILESLQNFTVVGVKKQGAETSIIPPHSFSYMRVLITISSEIVCINYCMKWTSLKKK